MGLRWGFRVRVWEGTRWVFRRREERDWGFTDWWIREREEG